MFMVIGKYFQIRRYSPNCKGDTAFFVLPPFFFGAEIERKNGRISLIMIKTNWPVHSMLRFT